MAPTFSEAVASSVQNAACALLALSDDATSFINGVIGADGDFGNIARALRKNVCNESAPTGDYGPSLPFEGGQCTTTYRAVFGGTWQRTNQIGLQDPPENPNTSSFGNLVGPIVRAELLEQPSLRRIRFEYENEAGTVQGTNIAVWASGQSLFANNLTFTLQRIDGQPDNCGDPEGDPVPPFVSYQETTNITYEDNSQTTINEGIDITIFAPIVGINAQLFAPITVSGNDFNLVGELTLSPEFKVELFPNGLGNPTGIIDGPTPTPGRDIPEPTPPPDRRVIVGAIVTVIDAQGGRATQIAQGENPDIFAPRFGNIAFYVSATEGTAWTNDIPVKTVRTYIPCPVDFGAVDVAGTADPGYQLDVQPVWGYPNQG